MSAVQPINSRLSQRKLLLGAFVEWMKEQRLIDLGLDLETQAAEMMDFVGITPVMQMVIGERALQEAKGFDAAHDDEHDCGELAMMAGAYVEAGRGLEQGWMNPGDDVNRFDDVKWGWPWRDLEGFHPRSSPSANYVTAAALLIAAAERLERAAERVPSRQGGQECPRSSPEGVHASGKEGLGDADC